MPDGSSVTATFHPYADIFPLMEGSEFDDLVADVAANGLQHPIVEYESAILDGRNRYRACIKAGVQAEMEKYRGKDPLAYVISANLKRRHLDESQRGLCAARAETLRQGRPQKGATGHLSRDDASRMFNVSRRTIARAAIVRDNAVPELAAMVDAGKVDVSTAAKVAALPAKEQKRLATEPAKAMKGAIKRIEREKKVEALAKPIARAAGELGAPQKLYSVLMADPPWRFEPYSRETGMDRAADNHYPTMTTDDICNLKVPSAKDAVLFLWATSPMLPEALRVMAAWGFIYKSHLVWLKDRIGTGYWFRSKHELLLVGTKGNIPAPAPGDQLLSVYAAAVQKHSQKPQVFFDVVEEMFPKVKAVELFAREWRLGWDSWGAELV